MPPLISLAACCVSAIGYLTFAVHYAEEAGTDRFGCPTEAKPETPSVMERAELPPPSPIQEPPRPGSAGELASPEPRTGYHFPELPGSRARPRRRARQTILEEAKMGRRGARALNKPAAHSARVSSKQAKG